MCPAKESIQTQWLHSACFIQMPCWKRQSYGAEAQMGGRQGLGLGEEVNYKGL